MKCKFCERPAPSNMRGYCQSCYKYFIIEKKQVYEKPEYGIINYTPKGDVICPFCGKAFRKLGIHFYYAHGLTSDKAHKKAGWDRNAKATNPEYRKLMRNLLKEHHVTDNLLEKGKKTRYKKGHKGRLKEKMSEMTKLRLKRK